MPECQVISIYSCLYLQSAVVDVWHEDQQAVIAELDIKRLDACLGMDMKAESMGHSAKNGRYSILELNEEKVIHIELVQVSFIT